MLNEIGGEQLHLCQLDITPPKFDRKISTLEIARFGKAFTKALRQARVRTGRTKPKEPDDRHRRLLRARRERPCGRAAERG